MKEAVFVRLNGERWQRFEEVLSRSGRPSPDELETMFIQLTDDLSYANTQYPRSRTAAFLNQLASRAHLEIYRNKRESKRRFITFWKYELPEEVFRHRRQLVYSLLIFAITALMGALSALYDETFVRLILGDSYVNMTIENIKNGNPLAVYGSSGMVESFVWITFNNIKVSLIIFAAGLIVSVGSGVLLFSNGVMLGAFLTFFFKQGLLEHSVSVVMLHGTIELSAMVIAGGAGMVMGHGILFPGTYSRLISFRMAARSGLKIVIGILPLIVIAGFIASFISRYTFMPGPVKALIIAGSAALIIYYFVVYPHLLDRHGKFNTH